MTTTGTKATITARDTQCIRQSVTVIPSPRSRTKRGIVGEESPIPVPYVLEILRPSPHGAGLSPWNDR